MRSPPRCGWTVEPHTKHYGNTNKQTQHILNTLQSPIKILLCVASILQNRGRTLFAPWKRTEHTWSWDISPGKEEGERKIGWILRNVVQHYSHTTLLSMRTLHTFKPANHNFRERKIKEVPNSVLQNPPTGGFARLLSLIPTTWWCNWYVSPVCPSGNVSQLECVLPPFASTPPDTDMADFLSDFWKLFHLTIIYSCWCNPPRKIWAYL